MGKENSHEEPMSECQGIEEEQNSTDDLKFMRSAVEKTYKQVNPDTHPMIMWGVICLVSYPAIHFIRHEHFNWIWAVFLPLVAFGLCYVFITWRLIIKRDKKAGFVSHLRKQLVCVLIITMVWHGLTWSILGMAFNNYCAGDPGFLFAILFSISLSIVGVFHTKEWLFGGIGIYIGVLLAFFIEDYSYIILGLATAAGLIIPAIIIQRNYRKQEQENQQAGSVGISE
ncbi:hypothetical protein ACFL3G_11805 [Planctomycetota bacterium]